MMAIDDDRSVFIQPAGVDEVVLDPGRAGDADPAINPSGNRDPSAVADRRDRLARRVEVANEFQHLRVTSELVGHKTPGDDERVEVGRIDLVDRHIRSAGVTVLPHVLRLPLWPGQRRRSPLLFEPQFRVPQLEVLVDLSGKDQDAFAEERSLGVVGHGAFSGCGWVAGAIVRVNVSLRGVGSMRRLPV
jgi:hypothetical protein